MLDAKCAQMLKTIQRECGDGSFKIFTNEDLCANFPKFEEPPAPEVVAEMVHFLEEREFIQVKYRDETSYCLTVLSVGCTKRTKQNADRRNAPFGSSYSCPSGADFSAHWRAYCLRRFSCTFYRRGVC